MVLGAGRVWGPLPWLLTREVPLCLFHDSVASVSDRCCANACLDDERGQQQEQGH